MPSKNLPLVSLVTICLNSEKYIRETIESVLEQDYPNLEYMIIDGASTDGTLSIVEEYVPQFKGEMSWLSGKDSGIYEAFNKGIAKTTGEIIGLLNSDDFYENSQVITDVVAAINEYDMAHGKMRIISEAGLPLKVYGNKNGKLQKYISAPFNHPTMFVKRYVYEKIGLFNPVYQSAGDYDFMLRFIRNGFRDIYLDQVITNFRTVGVTSAAQTLINPNELKDILCANGLHQSVATLLVWLRIIRAKLSRYLSKYPKLVKLIRKLLPYHVEDNSINKSGFRADQP